MASKGLTHARVLPKCGYSSMVMYQPQPEEHGLNAVPSNLLTPAADTRPLGSISHPRVVFCLLIPAALQLQIK